MNPELTADALVQLVHRYYPSGLNNYDPGYNESEEGRRLEEVLLNHLKPSPAWVDFIQRLRHEFPDCVRGDTTIPRHDPCYSARVALPGIVIGDPLWNDVVCLVSQIAPVYALYASHANRSKRGDHWLRLPPFPPEFQSHEARLSALIESIFGFTRLPNDVLLTPVPDLVPRVAHLQLGEAKLIDCLFTDHRW